MKIIREIYERLIQLPCVPPERGGILGGKKNIIDIVEIDIGKYFCQNGVYEPDVNFLNECIQEWDKEDVLFLGIFHTHALNWPDLSFDDKKYIINIMNSMPESIDKLYFPLVFPSCFIKAFVAERIDNHIFISEDDLEII